LESSGFGTTLGTDATKSRSHADSIAQEHDADLKDTGEHQDNSEPNIYVSKSRAASVERPVELFTLFAHACPLN
jgi:hypothetical protein